MPIRILLVDDHEVIRSGVSSLLDGSAFEVEVAEDKRSAFQMAKAVKPDAILMDVRLGKEDGLKVLSEFLEAFPTVSGVILSAFDNPTYIARSIAAGAKDYLLKDVNRDLLIRSILCAIKNIDPPQMSVVWPIRNCMRTQRFAPCPFTEHLTHRENQVLRHIALGLTNREISISLCISIETVKEHVRNILRKIDVVDRTAAAVWAVKHSLI